jgi:hypothetical protein
MASEECNCNWAITEKRPQNCQNTFLYTTLLGQLGSVLVGQLGSLTQAAPINIKTK